MIVEDIYSISLLISILLLGIYTFETENEKKAIFAGSLTLSIFSLLYILMNNYLAAIIQLAYAAGILSILTFTTFENVKKRPSKIEYTLAISLTIILLLILFPIFTTYKQYKLLYLENWFSIIFFITILMIFTSGLSVILNLLGDEKNDI